MAELLATSFDLRGRRIKNRLATLPMEANDAELDGSPSGRTLERYRRLSAGGWGTVYIEAVAPCERGKSRPRQLTISRKNLDSFKALIGAIRSASDPPPFIIIQINHAGRYALHPLIAYHSELLDPTWDIPPDLTPATTEELEEAAAAAAAAVWLAAQTGADAIDVKCCHGYLAAELLRRANCRQDKFGGSFQNRIRFLDIVLSAAAESAADFGVLFGSRVSLHEHFQDGIGSKGPGGKDIDLIDIHAITGHLMNAGASFICETMGIPYYNPEFVRPFAGAKGGHDIVIRHHMLAGDIKFCRPGVAVINSANSFLGSAFVNYAENDLLTKTTDLVGLGRQSFADPETPKKIFAGDIDSVRWCKACKQNSCSTLLRSRKEVGCVIHDPFYRNLLKQP